MRHGSSCFGSFGVVYVVDVRPRPSSEYEVVRICLSGAVSGSALGYSAMTPAAYVNNKEVDNSLLLVT